MSESDQFDYDVYISCSDEDEHWVRGQLVRALRGQCKEMRIGVGRECYGPGLTELEEMERCVLRSKKIVLVLSPAYLQSRWDEFQGVLVQTRYLTNHAPRLIPVVLKQCKLPLRLLALVRIDLTRPATRGTEFRRLLTTIIGEPVPPGSTAEPSEASEGGVVAASRPGTTGGQVQGAKEEQDVLQRDSRAGESVPVQVVPTATTPGLGLGPTISAPEVPPTEVAGGTERQERQPTAAGLPAEPSVAAAPPGQPPSMPPGQGQDSMHLPDEPQVPGIPAWLARTVAGAVAYLAFWGVLRTALPELFNARLAPWILALACLGPLLLFASLLWLRRRKPARPAWGDWDRIFLAWCVLALAILALLLLSSPHLWPGQGPAPAPTPTPTLTVAPTGAPTSSSATPTPTPTPTVTPTGVLTSPSATPTPTSALTVTPTGALTSPLATPTRQLTCGNVVVNGGFEEGGSGWVTTSSPERDLRDCEQPRAHSGTCYMWLGALSDRRDSETLCQDVQLPGDLISCTLSFFYYLKASNVAEPLTDCDHFDVFVRDRSGKVIAHPVALTNTQDNSARKDSLPWPQRYDQKSCRLLDTEVAAIRGVGGEIRICFEIRTNAAGSLAGFIDDVVLDACQ